MKSNARTVGIAGYHRILDLRVGSDGCILVETHDGIKRNPNATGLA